MDTTVQVTRERKDGNSYVVTAQDWNTYIRGRRLLKPISSPNTNEEKTSLQAPLTNTSSPDKCDTSADPTAMPRRSPRNHFSTRAADIEIAARLTTLYLCNLKDGSETLSANCRCGTQGLNRQSNFNSLEFRLPSPRVTWTYNIRRITDGVLSLNGSIGG